MRGLLVIAVAGCSFRAGALVLPRSPVPPILATLSERPRGLVLVTGPTGSGKSTTLAAMIDKINTERREHILTIEDPIEYIHQHKGCLVNQREVHSDTHGFGAALRAALREDPDIVLIGEMRDLETIESALRIAETGHLTFATLHTNSAAQTINRIIDIFPAHQQSQIRTQLSLVLEGTPLTLYFRVADGRIAIDSGHPGEADASLSGSPLALLSLVYTLQNSSTEAPGISNVRVLNR